MAEAGELQSGLVLADRYEIIRVLGEGLRKRTYLARDPKLDRLVAIGVARPGTVLSDPDSTEREAKILGRIGSHDSIVSVYDFEVDPDSSLQYIVFEYMAGEGSATR